eukprot:1930966-Rhodomonas_salina.6
MSGPCIASEDPCQDRALQLEKHVSTVHCSKSSMAEVCTALQQQRRDPRKDQHSTAQRERVRGGCYPLRLRLVWLRADDAVSRRRAW